MRKRFAVWIAGWLLLVLSIPQNVFGVSFPQNGSEKTKVACVGNSVTRGYGLRFPEKDSYPAQLQELLGQGFEVENFGHSGATLLSKGHRPYIETPEYSEALKFEADIVVIHLGLNDTDPRNWPNFRDEFIRDYMQLVESFRKNNNPEIYICRMSPIFHGHPRFKSGTRDWFWQIQDAIEQVAQNSKTGLIDLHEPLYSRSDLFADALHPNLEGAGIIAQTVYENITGDFGGLSLATVFMNHMVLQQNSLHVFFGKANAGETVTATFNGEVQTCVANASGDWKLTFKPAPAGGPYQFEVSAGKNQTILLDDILVGEVWICAGQSNMEFELKHAANASAVVSAASDENLRLLNKKGIVRPDNTKWDSTVLEKVNRLQFFEGEWKKSTPDAAAEFSAIGYSFGKMLRENLDVPVGLIQISVGGAPVEAFIDRKTLEFDPHLVDVLNNWKHNDFIQDWCRQRAATNLELTENKLQRHPFEPAYLYEAGVQSLAGFPVAGVIFYQGESNAHNAAHYQNAFPALVQSWRTAFNQPEMPFYFAQLSSINRPSWPYFRDVQRQLAQSIPNTEMVVTSDLGDSLDVHPKQKIEVGERFANIALSNVYNIEGFAGGGPKLNSIVQKEGKVILTFSNARRLNTSDDEPVHELEVAGKDGLFSNVKAEIQENQILIDSKDIAVKTIRYGWKPFSRGNLVNENGWPVSTFQFDIPYQFKKYNYENH